MKTFELLVLATPFTLIPASALADPGEPVAVRRSDGSFIIESMWNLSVQIVTAAQHRATPLQGVDLIRHQTGMPTPEFRFRHDAFAGTAFDYTLDRPPNVAKPSWTPTSEQSSPTSNAIRVRARGSVLVIDVDGVKITYIDPATKELDQSARKLTEGTRVLIAGTQSASGEGAPEASRLIESEILVLASDDDKQANNILAVSARSQGGTAARKTVLLNKRPLTLPVEIEKLMTAKEIASKASQEVFAPLTVDQMNFRPSNGSHTPRWNVEHMMGRELLFFSQIFAAQDPAIPVMDLNPEQMPPDYKAKHADWTGQEEARQMQRVSAFTSRFAHLIKDLPLDEKPRDSGWTLRGLLRQMDRHYSEHTANVKKKFELEDWPK